MTKSKIIEQQSNKDKQQEQTSSELIINNNNEENDRKDTGNIGLESKSEHNRLNTSGKFKKKFFFSFLASTIIKVKYKQVLKLKSKVQKLI